MLEVTGLHVGYGLIEAVRELSFRINQGTVVTLMGPNGAGKTTTLMALSGIVPVRSGTILWDSRDITRLSAHRRVFEGIVQVPEGRQVLAGMTVRENLELGGYRRPKREVAADIRKMEERFPILGQRGDTPAGSLSGGEQQMLAIARGLMSQPRLMLLDEPSMGLAPLLVEQIFSIVQDINKQGTSICLVEQNAQMALSIADRAYVLETGQVVLEGPGHDLLQNEMVMEAYLGGH